MPILVLVVDDNQDLRETLAELLNLEGFQVITASNGEDALVVLGSNETLPGVILSDWRMPDMDGEGLYQALRADPRFQHIPFILMGQFQSSHEILQNFPNAQFLAKPFNPEELINMIRSL